MAAFKQRFGAANRTGALDWAPLATLGSTVAIYDPADRNGGQADTSPLAIASTAADAVMGFAIRLSAGRLLSG